LLATGNRNVAAGHQAARYQSGGTTPLTTINNSLHLGYLTKGTQSATNEIAVGYAAEGRGSNTAQWGNTSIVAHYMSGLLDVLSTTEQIRASYSAAVYTSMTTDSGGYFTIDPTGGTTVINSRLFAGSSLHLATADAYFYLLGDATTDGSVRMSYQAGSDAVLTEKRVSGSWVTKLSTSMV